MLDISAFNSALQCIPLPLVEIINHRRGVEVKFETCIHGVPGSNLRHVSGVLSEDCRGFLHYFQMKVGIMTSEHHCRVGRDSVVSMATGEGLDGRRIEIPLGTRFSAPVQTGTGAPPASCAMGTGSLSRR